MNFFRTSSNSAKILLAVAVGLFLVGAVWREFSPGTELRLTRGHVMLASACFSLIAIWAVVIPAIFAGRCRVIPVSSRMCEMGTKSCVVNHTRNAGLESPTRDQPSTGDASASIPKSEGAPES